MIRCVRLFGDVMKCLDLDLLRNTSSEWPHNGLNRNQIHDNWLGSLAVISAIDKTPGTPCWRRNFSKYWNMDPFIPVHFVNGTVMEQVDRPPKE